MSCARGATAAAQLTCGVDCSELFLPCALGVVGVRCPEEVLRHKLSLFLELLLSLGALLMECLLGLELDLGCTHPFRRLCKGDLECHAGGGDGWAAGFTRHTGSQETVPGMA
ncbi:hypothetical protein MTO96_033577 [Rhipicephalus appendiculatus]